MKPTLVIMAAGMGSRYGGLKQIDPIGPSGEIVIDYSAYDAIRAGFGKIVFIIRKDIAAAFRQVVEPRLAGRIAVQYAFQELDDIPAPFKVPPDRTKPWGTAQAILCCRNVVAEPFGVINADDFYGRQSFQILSRLLQERRPDEAAYALIGFLMKNTLSEHGAVSRGVCDVDVEGRLKSVIERTKIERRDGNIAAENNGRWENVSGETIVSMNMWGFTPALFPQLEKVFVQFLKSQASSLKSECYIPAVVDQLINAREAHVDVASSPDAWLGMTYPEDKPAVKAGILALVQSGEYPERLWG